MISFILLNYLLQNYTLFFLFKEALKNKIIKEFDVKKKTIFHLTVLITVMKSFLSIREVSSSNNFLISTRSPLHVESNHCFSC